MFSYYGEIKTVADLAFVLSALPNEMPLVMTEDFQIFFSRLTIETRKMSAKGDRGEYVVDVDGEEVAWIY